MDILRLSGVGFVYPPRFRHHRSGVSDFQDESGYEVDEDLVGVDGGERPSDSGSVGDQPTTALVDVTFSVAAGEAVALLGSAGSGRSTLLSLVAGMLKPTQGRIQVRGHATGAIAAGAGFARQLSVGENIVRNLVLTGMPHRRANQLVPEVLSWSGLPHPATTPSHQLSRVETKRLGYAVALHTEPTLMLADEDVAFGSAAIREAVADRLATFPASGRGLLLATNRRDLIDRLCTRAIVLDGGAVAFDGTVEAAQEHRKLLRRQAGAHKDPDSHEGR